jgi:hypothetical protein
MEWVVYAKRPFGGPRRVLKYLARYTHRVAISNHRLRALDNGRVSFDWKDYARRNRTSSMSLDAVEFLRRFLLQVLPSGLVRIRQFGFLANRVRKQKLEHCRALLAVTRPQPCLALVPASSLRILVRSASSDSCSSSRSSAPPRSGFRTHHEVIFPSHQPRNPYLSPGPRETSVFARSSTSRSHRCNR